MVDILDEVLSDSKDEKRLLLFRKFLPIVIFLTIAGALVIGINSWYKNKVIFRNQQVGDIIIELFSSEVENKDLVTDSLKQIIDTNENRQTELAELELINHLQSSNKPDEVLARLENIISNTNYSDITKSYAMLLWLGIILDREVISDVEHVKARTYMEHFTNKDQPFFANATLMKSLFYKKIEQKEAATEYAEIVVNLENISIILKEQATAILTNLKNNL